MEGWLYGLFALIGVLLGGIFSYLGVKKQVEHSDGRFEKELARAREENQQKRRWEVRSEPLLKLRTELAQMASKLDKLARSAHQLHTHFNKTEEQVQEEFLEAVND